MQELQRTRRPANEVTRVDLVVPRIVGTEIIHRKTQREVLKQVKRGTRKGWYASCSPVARVSAAHGGGYAVKVKLLKEPPAPLPMWARVCVIIGLVLIGVVLAIALLAAALSALLGSLLALPLQAIGGVLVFLALLTAATSGGRRCCRVIVEVFH